MRNIKSTPNKKFKLIYDSLLNEYSIYGSDWEYQSTSSGDYFKVIKALQAHCEIIENFEFEDDIIITNITNNKQNVEFESLCGQRKYVINKNWCEKLFLSNYCKGITLSGRPIFTGVFSFRKLYDQATIYPVL